MITRTRLEGRPAGAAVDRSFRVPVGISVRHIHLTRRDVDLLFGRNYFLTPKRPLSQPGQYAAEECLDLIGPKGTLDRVRILGPVRKHTQIEVSRTDCHALGISAPVRPSGQTEGTPGIVLRGPHGTLEVSEGVIIAERHLHIHPDEARRHGLADGDRVSVRIEGIKPGIWKNVTVRSNSGCALDLHVDTDDANAFALKQGQLVTVLGKDVSL